MSLWTLISCSCMIMLAPSLLIPWNYFYARFPWTLTLWTLTHDSGTHFVISSTHLHSYICCGLSSVHRTWLHYNRQCQRGRQFEPKRFETLWPQLPSEWQFSCHLRWQWQCDCGKQNHLWNIFHLLIKNIPKSSSWTSTSKQGVLKPN